MMPFGATIALAVSLVTGSNGTFPTAPSIFDQSQTVEEYVRASFADVPVMAEVASCESHFRQFDNKGQVIKNANSSAVGVFQIMASIHASVATSTADGKKKLMAATDDGTLVDIYSLEGNVAYARSLYETSGTAPWNASKPCWSKSQAYQNLQKVAVK